MPSKKHHHHKNSHHNRNGSDKHDNMPVPLERSKRFTSNPMTTFAKDKDCNDRHSQEVTVTVTVNEKQDDCLSSCFKSCFSIGKNAAK